MDDADIASAMTEVAYEHLKKRRQSITAEPKRYFINCQYCADPSGGEEFCSEECRIDGLRMRKLRTGR